MSSRKLKMEDLQNSDTLHMLWSTVQIC